MKTKNTKTHLITYFLPIGLLLIFLIFSQCQTINERLDAPLKKEKQKGAHVFGSLKNTDFQFLTRNNIEWVTLVPWADQKDFDSSAVRHFSGDSLMMIQQDSRFLQRVASARQAGFKVFVKPHIWIYAPTNGKWRSDIYPNNDEDWELWKKTYREFIMRYAKLAQQGEAEMYCIGTEFSRLSTEKPLFWDSLITEVRSVYKGKITYAANWYEEYEKISFWDDLDYIGIQAYFPLVDHKNPDVEQISSGWAKYLPTLEAIHKKHNQKILFTELGYKSTEDSAAKPWEWVDNPESHNKLLSYQTQVNCYRAFFDTVWEKDWFAGVHLWQFRADYASGNHSASYDLDFSPLGKPAEELIRKNFE
jgi:hypothetical protein